MTTRFGNSATYPRSVASMRATFVDEKYWTDRLAEVGGPGARLVGVILEGAHTQVRMVQVIAASELPEAITKVRPADLIIPRSETWGPESATFEATVEGVAVRIWGTMALSDHESGCSLQLSGQVEVDVPLFGGKIEKAVAERLDELFAVEHEFTLSWSTEHDGHA